MSRRQGGKQTFGRGSPLPGDKPKTNPGMRFDMEEMARAGGSYSLEVQPVGRFYAFRFFNDLDSVMMIASEEIAGQIHREIGNALGLSRQRRRKSKGLQAKPSR